MKFRSLRPAEAIRTNALIVPVFSDAPTIPAALPRAVRATTLRVLKAMAGTRRLYGVTTHYRGTAPERLILVGAGRHAELTPERLRNVTAAGVRSLWRAAEGVRTGGAAASPPEVRRIAVVVDEGLGNERAVEATVQGAIYAMWRPETHRSRPEPLPAISTVGLVASAVPAAAIRRGEAIGEAVNFARRLANEPANLMTPTNVADEARSLAKAAGLVCEVLDEKRCRALGMHSFLSVAQGSHQPPRLVVLRYHGRAGKGYDLALVGKGITFDSGGISIKPAEGMHRLKVDMTGAASVIGTMGAVARLRPAANILGVALLTENLPGGGATKPGDVFTSMSGKTVEVINTDAEGRLVLIDGLTYAQREGATRVVDIATLTGATHLALGDHFSGLFGKPDAFVAHVLATSRAAGDRFWPMPLTDDYREEVRSDIADLRNSAGKFGGASTAAAFLDAVIDDGVEWAHLDIAGRVWSERDQPFSPPGPQGPVVRTLVALALAAAGG